MKSIEEEIKEAEAKVAELKAKKKADASAAKKAEKERIEKERKKLLESKYKNFTLSSYSIADFIKDSPEISYGLTSYYGGRYSFPAGWTGENIEIGGYNEERFIVIKFSNAAVERFFKIDYWSSSYGDSEINWDEIYEVTGVEKMVTEWQRK